MKIQEEIKNEIEKDSGFIIGFADIEEFLFEQYRNYKYAISVGKMLDKSSIDEIKQGPTERYYLLYKRTNDELSDKIKTISNYLCNQGIKNLPIKPTFEDKELDEEYSKTLRTPFSHKFAATRAGLGWIGKTDLLVTKEFGPRIRLASILIEKNNYKFMVNEAIIKSKCGDCEVCVTHCPAHAANGKLWDINTDRDVFFDAFKCREKCRELSRKNINRNMSLCGICVSVCPLGMENKRKYKNASQ